MGVVFWASSRITKAFDNVRPLMKASGAISISPKDIFFKDIASVLYDLLNPAVISVLTTLGASTIPILKYVAKKNKEQKKENDERMKKYMQDIQDEVIKQIGLLEYLCKQEGENVAESFKRQRNHLYRTKKYARQLKEASEQKN